MKKVALIVLLTSIITSVAQATPKFQVGGGAGIVLPDVIYELKVLGDLSLSNLITLRTSLGLSSLFGVFILPLDETAIFQFGERLKFYFGVGAGVLMIKSSFGSTTNFSYSSVGGIVFAPKYLSFFTQLKFRVSGERVTYQIDMGVIF